MDQAPSFNSLNTALMDVRKAYRLLYLYQRRILDTIECFRKELNNRIYSGGWPKFSNLSPGYGRGDLDSWAWDWLNLYSYEFHFRGDNKTMDNFSILHVADTGWYDRRHMKEISRTEIEEFSPPEKSESLFLFVAQKTNTTWKGPRIEEILLSNDFYQGANKMTYSDDYVECKAVLISECIDQEACISVIERIKDYFLRKGINISAEKAAE